MKLFYECILAIIGFSSGLVVAAGIFSFIAMIGVVPRMAIKTQTMRYIPLYEDVIILGGIWGCSIMFIHYHIPIGVIGAIIFSLASGIFIGCLAVSLAEVLNVMPVFSRRVRLQGGLAFIIVSLALGKTAGSLLYFIFSGFYAG